MRKFFVILIGIFLTMSLTFAQGTRRIESKPEQKEEAAEPAIKILYAEGEVYLENDILTTAKGRAEICLGEENFLKVDRNTKIVLNDPIEILWGSVYVEVNSGVVQIQINSAVRILGQGTHRLDVKKNGEVEYFQGSRPIDSFGSWNSKREMREIYRPVYNPWLGYRRSFFSPWNPWGWSGPIISRYHINIRAGMSYGRSIIFKRQLRKR